MKHLPRPRGPNPTAQHPFGSQLKDSNGHAIDNAAFNVATGRRTGSPLNVAFPISASPELRSPDENAALAIQNATGDPNGSLYHLQAIADNARRDHAAAAAREAASKPDALAVTHMPSNAVNPQTDALTKALAPQWHGQSPAAIGNNPLSGHSLGGALAQAAFPSAQGQEKNPSARNANLDRDLDALHRPAAPSTATGSRHLDNSGWKAISAAGDGTDSSEPTPQAGSGLSSGQTAQAFKPFLPGDRSAPQSYGQIAGLDLPSPSSNGGDPDNEDERAKRFRTAMGQGDAPAGQSYQSPDNVAQAYA